MGWRQLSEGGQQNVDVELVEADAPAVAPVGDQGTAPERPAREGRRRARRGVRGRWTIAVVALVAVVAVAVNVWDARREADRRGALTQVPGILDPVIAPLDAAWTVPDASPAGEAAGLVIVSADTDGAVSALDPASGQVRWSRPAPGPLGSAAETCAAARTGDSSEVVLCLRSTTLVYVDGVVDPAATRVTVLDPLTGEEGAVLDVPGVLLDRQVLDGDVVLVLAEHDGTLRVVRWTMGTGQERWSYSSAEPLIGLDGTAVSFLDWDRDILAVGGGDRLIQVALATGADAGPADPSAARVWHDTAALPGGWTAWWGLGLDGGLVEGVVRDADGAVRYDLPGRPLTSTVDDGSGGVLIVTTDGPFGLEGLDRASGERLWAAALDSGVTSADLLATVDGIALVSEGTAVLAVDAADGAVLWRERVDDTMVLSPLTDGEVVLLPQRERGDLFLVAHRLTDGSQEWRLVLPSGTAELRSIAGHVVVVTAGATLGLR